MSSKSWPTEPLIMIAEGRLTGVRGERDMEVGSLAVRDPEDGWYWSTDGGWLTPESAEIHEYVPVIPVSLDGSLSMTWFTKYAPADFAPSSKDDEKETEIAKYRKATDFMATWEGSVIGDDTSAVEFIADMDLDDDTDMLKLAAAAYCASDILCHEAAEKAEKTTRIDRAEILRLAFKADNASDPVENMDACSELAVAALARWAAMQ